MTVYVGFLYFRYWLVGVLHIDDVGLECAWIVHDEAYVRGDNQLITSVLQLVDASDTCWHGNPGEMVLLVVDSHLAVGRSEEDGVAHFSEPLEGCRGMEVLAINECSLVGENPFTASLVLLDKPYVAALQSFFSHLDELGFHAFYVVALTYTDQEVLLVSRNPGMSIGEWIYLICLQMDAEALAEHFADSDELAWVGVEDVYLAVEGDNPHIVVRAWEDGEYAVGTHDVDVVGLVTECLEMIAVVIGQTIPGAKPHQVVVALCQIGNGVGCKSIED